MLGRNRFYREFKKILIKCGGSNLVQGFNSFRSMKYSHYLRIFFIRKASSPSIRFFFFSWHQMSHSLSKLSQMIFKRDSFLFLSEYVHKFELFLLCTVYLFWCFFWLWFGYLLFSSNILLPFFFLFKAIFYIHGCEFF